MVMSVYWDLRRKKPKPKFLKCDVENCEESAQWFRRWKGKLLKLCTKHEADMRRQHLGRPVDPKELDNYDWAYLERKDLKDDTS